MLNIDMTNRLGNFRISQQDARTTMCDDVLNLFGRQAKVDGDQDSSPAAHPKERGQHPSRVVRDDRHSISFD